ncbi:hypothetical protein EMIHUDRAFT_441122 [Emiliania huxleyi CCMP1516]|uniref:Uncharacterized protein n=2 Tax=Emiliania huxleyi TaxID=2903 RepID=A0A0D3KGF2_EMIH1|nr:hypothetical protein EMIHUDRAFT_441122 [Emiliania huxleyi CCMP1516]EOD34837.1 hypothetical protein EMIHUDRAFT_441122 [Emiliania huxleyi CCMP1516]|eukprot:XP_005787266.1 hypothetical protein EMIHUDRAFT_441122 [Emiliania huxleyi CCMP1516]
MALIEYPTKLHEAAAKAETSTVASLINGDSIKEVDSLNQTPLIMCGGENFKMTPLPWGGVGAHKPIAESHPGLPPPPRDGLDHFGNEYKGTDKAQQIGKYSDFVEYLESLPGIKKKE